MISKKPLSSLMLKVRSAFVVYRNNDFGESLSTVILCAGGVYGKRAAYGDKQHVHLAYGGDRLSSSRWPKSPQWQSWMPSTEML
jgi:hypothetical protein